MDFEVFLAQADHFLQPGFVAADGRGMGSLCELRLKRRPQTRKSAVEQGRGETIEGKTAPAFFDDEAGFLQQAQMARDTGLRDAEHRRQLGHVQPSVFSGQHAQQPKPHFVAQAAVQLAGLLHIHEYISMYVIMRKV